jgi:hypothetical protein
MANALLVDLDGVTDILTFNQTNLTKVDLKVGEEVGFLDSQNQEIYGIIKRLNPKTVTILTSDTKLKVHYCYLFKVFSGDCSNSPIIEMLS